MSSQLKYEDVEQYLRTFSTEESPYNFGGLLHLVLAGVENLREHISDADVLENAHFITDAQANLLHQLLETRADSIAWFEDDIGHSAQTGQL